jgi:putative membrane protein
LSLTGDFGSRLGISASYEFIEWWTALISGSASTEFLATQGDVWDTQKDMFMALIGAISALVFMSHWQDRQLESHHPDFVIVIVLVIEPVTLNIRLRLPAR